MTRSHFLCPGIFHSDIQFIEVFGVAGDDCKPVAEGRSSQERVDSGEDLAALARLSFPLSPQVSAIEIDGQDTFSETSNEICR